jgi:hypothetical protein
VPWLIATYGLSYAKSIQLDLLKEMLIAIINENQLMGERVSCLAQSKTYLISFNDLARQVKSAAGLYFYVLCFACPCR